MKHDRNSVKKSFSRAADTYDSNSTLQKEVASDLARRAGALIANTVPHGAFRVSDSKAAGRFLDVGCGTGNLIGEIKKVCPEASVYGCDISLQMLLKTRSKYCDKSLAASDCGSLPFAPSSFDFVASSLTYQWAQDLNAAFREAERVLRPEGLFFFTTLGPSTLNELRTAFRAASPSSEGFSLMEFKGTDEVSEAVEEAGLECLNIEAAPIVKRYADLMELLKTLKKIGASPPVKSGKGLSMGLIIKEAAKAYAERFPAPDGGGIVATYEVIFAAARKNRKISD